MRSLQDKKDMRTVEGERELDTWIEHADHESAIRSPLVTAAYHRVVRSIKWVLGIINADDPEMPFEVIRHSLHVRRVKNLLCMRCSHVAKYDFRFLLPRKVDFRQVIYKTLHGLLDYLVDGFPVGTGTHPLHHQKRCVFDR